MPLPCPYLDYVTPTDTPQEEAAKLFEHLGEHPEHEDQQELFDELASKMRSAPIPNR